MLIPPLNHWTLKLWQSFSAAGLLIGLLFFAASLTPSLLPRTYVVQGILSGCSAAFGYGVGTFGLWLWSYLELPKTNAHVRRYATLLAALIFLLTATVFLWKKTAWQNTVRGLMEMEPVDSSHPVSVGLIALAVFLVLLTLSKLFAGTARVLSQRSRRYVPRRVSYVVGAGLSLALFWLIIDGVGIRYGLQTVDASLRKVEALVDIDIEQPDDPLKTGSPDSLIAWESLGRNGRTFLSSGPTREDITAFAASEALEPIRVYVGLRSADTAKARAKLALDELIRIGAFDRSVLIVATPTGTGWLDAAGMDTIEYLHGGDVASVAIQYSYLLSWLSLLVEPGYATEAADALFTAVYTHWRGLPKDQRPKLYLYGLSLGAFGSESSVNLFDVLADPFQGALWAGPPFPGRTWQDITRDRNPGTPAWLPRYRDSSIVRFTSQADALSIPGAVWGPMRIVYLQYASDPITFYEPSSIFQQPAWMHAPRGPDVSPEFQWYPIITFLQLTVDLATATTTPIGYGHVYASEHYIDAWIGVTAPEGWTPAEIARLKQHFANGQ
ncbi:MAG: alpha/beta hydrolase [Geminicoccaceae bacterium]